MLLLLPPCLSLTIFLLSFLGSPRWCCSFGWWSCGCGAEHRRENRMMMGGGSKYPFTASQWQELELQALIFKYMVSGIPVPPDLILCIRKSLFMDPHTLPFLPHPPPIGWETYQLGDGRKSVDPEPGRCRRTDGKKWRCSKEAYPDSKYCERHMHRGKSRSRKPVELSLATNPTSPHFSSSNLPPPPRSRPQSHHFLSPCSSSSRPPAMGHSRQDDSAVDNYRNLVGFKEDVHEYRFFSEPCRGVREIPCRFGPVDVSSVEETKQRYGYMQSTDPHFRICLSEEQEKEKNCFEIGADFKTQRAATLGREEQPQNVRPFHCFLDEKPPKMEESWMSMDVDQSKQVSDLKTRLSISIPATASQRYNDG